jgi:chemotaxis protein histidine kinase CheA
MTSTPASGQYETIDPPNPLRAKVRILTGRDANFDPVKRAELAIERLSGSFSDWMMEEVERLLEQWSANKSAGFAPQTRAALYRVAHDIRGQAATLGYPSAGRVAGVFCDILDSVESRDVPDAFLEQYVTAIRAIARETERGKDSTLAQNLADELAKAGQELIAAAKTSQSGA